MTSTFEKFIERQKELVAKATWGPWSLNKHMIYPVVPKYSPYPEAEPICEGAIELDWTNNSQFIANARNTAEIQTEMLEVMFDAILEETRNHKDCSFRCCPVCDAKNKVQQLAEKALKE